MKPLPRFEFVDSGCTLMVSLKNYLRVSRLFKTCSVSLLSAIMIFLCLLHFTALAQLKYLGNVKDLPGHPRIQLLRGEEVHLAKIIASDSTWRRVHQVILSECDALIAKEPVQRIKIGRRLLATSRECLRRVYVLSYAWRMTHEEKYLKRAEKELLAVSAFSDWNPTHFLDVAEMTMATAIGYDWLYDDLPSSSRAAIKDAILKKGIEPSLDSKYNGWLSRTNNWNQVCNAGMTFGALAIYEDYPDLARKILDRAIETIQLSMDGYGPDGAYPEGYGYWGYGTNFNVMFLQAIEKIYGTDFGLSNKPGFLKTAGYLENMTGPSGESFNYSDSAPYRNFNPAMFWFADRLKDYALLYAEKACLADRQVLGGHRLLPAVMIWGGGIDIRSVSTPQQLIWVGQGKNPVALMRSSWADPNAIFVGMKGGSASVSHSHLDVGTFVMDAEGVRWAMDLGPQDYNSLETKGVNLWDFGQTSQRWEVFRYNNFVHNTLTVIGERQWVDGYASITGSTANPGFLSATTDISQVYRGSLSSAHRGIAIIDSAYVVVQDEMETGDKEANVRWTLLTPARVKITGKSTAELTQSGKKLLISVRKPNGAVLKTWSTKPTHDYDAPNPGTTLVGFEIRLPANSKGSSVVLLVPRGVQGKTEREIPELNHWSDTNQ